MSGAPQSKEELVEKLLELTGAPRGKEEVARRNFRRRSDEELSGLYSRLVGAAALGRRHYKPTVETTQKLNAALHRQRQALDRLRAIPLRREDAVVAMAEIGPLVQAEMSGDSDLSKIISENFEQLMVLWLSDRAGEVEEELRRELLDVATDNKVMEQFELNCRRLLENAGRSSLRLLRNELAHRFADNTTFLLDVFGRADPVVANGALEPVYLSAPDGRLSSAQAIDGVVKVRHYAQAYHCDLITYCDKGGEAVGRHLSDEIKHRTGRKVHVIDIGKVHTANFDRCLLVTDVVRDVDVLESCQTNLRSAAKGAEVRLAAIAGSPAEHDRLGGDKVAYFSHLTLHGSADVPWDPKGGYRATAKRLIFGTGSKSLPIQRDFMDRLEADLTASGTIWKTRSEDIA